MMIEVKVKPRAKKTEVIKVGKGMFEVSVKALPDKGRANTAVVKVIADYFNVAPSLVSIVRGHRAWRKIIEILE